MNILDRTLVIKSPTPPEDIRVLWIDMSTKPKSIKIWDSNTGNWENLDSSEKIREIEDKIKDLNDTITNIEGVGGFMWVEVI